MILETAGLSFLGLGSQPPQADLGSMLGEARAALITSPHTSFVPGAMILIIVMGVNLLGDGIRDALDPRLKAGALSRPQPATKVARFDPTAPQQLGADAGFPMRQGPRHQSVRQIVVLVVRGEHEAQ